jgi:hypothetical protein
LQLNAKENQFLRVEFPLGVDSKLNNLIIGQYKERFIPYM